MRRPVALAVNALVLVALLGCSTTGTPDFDVTPVHPVSRPMAPGARVQVRIASNLRRQSPFGFSTIYGTDQTFRSSDPAVARLERLQGLGPVSGAGRDLSGVGIVAYAPGTTTITVSASVDGHPHAETLEVEVREATWTYLHDGAPVVADLEVPVGERVELVLEAAGPGGEPLLVAGAHFDDGFSWSTLKSGVVRGRASCALDAKLALAKSPHHVVCAGR